MGDAKRKHCKMNGAAKIATVVLALAVLAGAAPVPEKSLVEQQTELYNSMLVQEDTFLEPTSAKMDAGLKAKVVEEGESAEAPKEWVDDSTAPEIDDDTEAPVHVDDEGVPHDADWHPAATSIQRNCMQLKVFGYCSVDYREDIKEPNRALGVINDLFNTIAPGMYNETNETPEACVAQYNEFVMSIKSGCDEVESIPCKMITAIQESMQKDGLLKKFIDDDDFGKKKTSIDAKKVGLAQHDALSDVEIGVTDSEIALTLRDMKDEYAAAMSHVPATDHSEPELTPEETHTYDTWHGD